MKTDAERLFKEKRENVSTFKEKKVLNIIDDEICIVSMF